MIAHLETGEVKNWLVESRKLTFITKRTSCLNKKRQFLLRSKACISK